MLGKFTTIVLPPYSPLQFFRNFLIQGAPKLLGVYCSWAANVKRLREIKMAYFRCQLLLFLVSTMKRMLQMSWEFRQRKEKKAPKSLVPNQNLKK